MEHTIEFWLPFPPSTNRLWRSVRGRVVLSLDYKQWKKRALEAVYISQKLGSQPVLGIHELGKECRLLVDDKLCRRASVEWATIDHDCLVKLTGDVAYKDQWEFAAALANKQAARNRSRIVRSARNLR